jgi:hypothetical protein
MACLIRLFLIKPILTCFWSSNHLLLAILPDLFHLTMLFVDEVALVLGKLAEINAQVSQAIFTFF